MVGQALIRRLTPKVRTPHRRPGIGRSTATGGDRNLGEQFRPQAVFVAAATVGGILANNSYPGSFLYDNLMIAANVIDASRRVGSRS